MATIDNRGRKSATILTERDCTRRVTERTKLYDKKCRGLYVSIIPAGVATFSFKFTDPATHKQRSRLLGIHSPAFTVEDARTVVYALRNRMGQGENIAQTQRQDNELKAKQGVTVDQVNRGHLCRRTRQTRGWRGGTKRRLWKIATSRHQSALRTPTQWSQICGAERTGTAAIGGWG
jgi:hypothetical protein